MARRLNRDAEYVVVQDRSLQKAGRYHYDTDDDNDSQVETVTRRIVRKQPVRQRHIKYVTADEEDHDQPRHRLVQTDDPKLKFRNTVNGEPVVLDEDDNVIKIVRNVRSPTPPKVEKRRTRIRAHEPRTVYYNSSPTRVVAHAPKLHTFVQPKAEFVHAGTDRTKLLRKVIIDPRTGDQQTIYEDKPRIHHRKKYVVRKHVPESGEETDGEDMSQPQYVQVVQRQVAPTQVITRQEKPATKYMMVRKKVESEPVYAAAPPIPTMRSNRRVVYQTAAQKPATTYVYSTDDKYYK